VKRIVLVGGGTAGHVEPALAVGRWLSNTDSDISLEFLGTTKGIEVELLVDTGIKFHPISKVPFPRKISFSAISWPFKFLTALVQTTKAIFGSDLVIGFGGYVSAPAYLIAKFLNIPIIIHEANAAPGLANSLGAKITKHIFVAFESVKSIGGRWKDAQVIGMPIKESIDGFSTIDKEKLRLNLLNDLSLPTANKTILIFGGSIGAARINDSVTKAADVWEKLGWNVIHSVGFNNSVASLGKYYRALPYITDMTSAYASADFVISRSGAVTCAELAAVGVPALLVPLEIGNGEQSKNALELVKTGQAQLVNNSEFSDIWLRSNLTQAIKDTEKKTPQSARHAASKIGEAALDLIKVSK
jgi:UDP-N-acetylglucosamine--N-acetylmuramyl-(pentapeptide) pyrophosphoryl-undecaprenol N-acetylglucosamine transferase